MKKVILVGIGGFANAWIPVITEFSEIEFSGFVEVNPKTITDQINRYGFERELIFPTLDIALNHVKADGIINVTPPGIHKEISLRSLDAGIPVLSEKPLADSIESATAIVEKSNETGILHMVAQDYRYKPPIQTVKNILESGEYGQIGSVRLDFSKGPQFKDKNRNEMSQPLLLDMSIHHFDLVRFFLESELESVQAHSWKPAWNWFKGYSAVTAIMKFENRVPVTYTASWCGTGHDTSWSGNWRIDCEYGVVLLVDDCVYVHPRTDEIEDLGGYTQYVNQGLTHVPLLTPEFVSQAQLLKQFYDALTIGTQPATNCQDNIKSLEIVFRVIRASEKWK
jgi:predicted dehydrogenase